MEEDDSDVPPKSYPLSPSKMSKTPSWIMLGFVLGALTVISLPPFEAEPEPIRQVAREPEPPRGPVKPPELMKIEAVFAEWGQHAVWDDGTTEVAMWNPDTGEFSEYFEVVRFGNNYYFRTLPFLTRREILRGKPMPESPLRFTETEEQYQEWRQHGRSERSAESLPSTPQYTAPKAPAVKIDRPAVELPPSERPHFENSLTPIGTQSR